MNRTRYPCRQLNSNAIRSAALCYVSPIVVGKCSIVSAKCVSNVTEEGLQKSWNDVCKTRDFCDEAIHGVKNVAFFFSAISAQSPTKSRGKKTANAEEENGDDNDEGMTPSQVASTASREWLSNHSTVIDDKLRPSLSYWIALITPNGAPANPIHIHRALLDCGVEVTANQVPCHEGKESICMKELFQTLKDHKNTMIQDLVNSSYERCFHDEMDNLLGDVDLLDSADCGTERATRVCLVKPSFNTILQVAIAKLQEAKLVIDQFGFNTDISSRAPEQEEARLSDKLTVLVNDVGLAMKRMEYALFRGKIYKKCPSAKYTYSYKCEVRAFVNCLAANELFKARLVKDMKKIIDILADPDCEVIRPICVDYNLIEVNAGQCWSIQERRFLKNPIPDQKMGLVTPRAFTKYDPCKEPDAKYFREILQNSLTEAEIGAFCEDFLKLLNFNKKRHKDRVLCLIGDANSGKTSLFHPIFGLVHHSNIATVTKQRVFNKAMITKFTEVIFIDEASPSTMDVDDWKILTQGGYTACDIKYRTAQSFMNRCPMLITAQQELHFKPEDQPAMDRRLRNYIFKSLPATKKRAADWLRKHPMECVVWAAAKARRAEDEEATSETSDEEDDHEMENEDGTLYETEKEALRTMPLVDVLEEQCEEHAMEARDNSNEDSVNSDEEPSVATLEKIIDQCSPRSLRHRHVTRILETRLEENARSHGLHERAHKERQRILITRGVTREHASLLPRDGADPLPTQIVDDLAAFKQKSIREELEAQRNRSREAFEAPWLRSTEIDLQECTMALCSPGLDTEKRASLEAYQDVLQDKLNNHHRNLGTLGCTIALDQRKRTCVALGLLRKEHRHLVTSLFQTLPTVEESSQVANEHDEESSAPPSDKAGKSSDDEAAIFITPVPRSQISNTAPERSTRISPKKRKSAASKEKRADKKPRNTILNYFSQK